jgi:hypothetical protein
MKVKMKIRRRILMVKSKGIPVFVQPFTFDLYLHNNTWKTKVHCWSSELDKCCANDGKSSTSLEQDSNIRVPPMRVIRIKELKVETGYVCPILSDVLG